MANKTRRLIGLTGGIATGKSTVSCYLSEKYKLPILDADIYAREAVRFGSPILKEIFERYGIQVRSPDGSLNRQSLGNIIFSNPDEKKWLEARIHPYVKRRFDEAILQTNEDLVLAIPLLFEAKLTDRVTEIWVVVCSQAQQIQRIIRRDQLSEEQAMQRINQQLPLTEKVSQADIVINNHGSVDQLRKQIDFVIMGNRKHNSSNDVKPS